MESNDIGKRIAILRKQKGWSQMELAEKLNVTDKAVSKWENGGMPSIDLLPKLSEIFNVTIDHLILGDKENEKKSQDSEIKKDNKETEVAQDEFSVEGLSIEDIKLILRDQRDLYTETEIELLQCRLQELNNMPEGENKQEEKSSVLFVHTNCGVILEEYERDEEDCDENENDIKVNEGIGCVGYFVAWLFPLIGLIWGIVKNDKGVVAFSTVMLLLNILITVWLVSAFTGLALL